MPGGDRTGPNGQGAKTGRQLGYCSGNDVPGYNVDARGRGYGMGYGRGGRGGRRMNRGYGRRFYSSPLPIVRAYPEPIVTSSQQRPTELIKQDLENQKAQLEFELEQVKKALENQTKPKSDE